MGFDYDKDGQLAAAADVDFSLLEVLNNLDYYKQKPPKSLGREWIEQHWNPLIDKMNLQAENMLATFTRHIADQITFVLKRQEVGKVLLTGGGAKNNFLIELLRKQNKHEIVVPEALTIDYKEALIFAFMALLRHDNQVNVMASVTGGKSDISAGTIFYT
jgi:anhydro-N-acetylmuramic acid kinase